MTTQIVEETKEKQYPDACGRCETPNSCTDGAYFCRVCVLNMIPKIYPCLKCKQEYCTNSVDRMCFDCKTEWDILEIEELLKKRPLDL
jgi:hypothetical protein